MPRCGSNFINFLYRLFGTNLVPFVRAQLALKLEYHIKEKKVSYKGKKSMKIKKLLRNYPAEVM